MVVILELYFNVGIHGVELRPQIYNIFLNWANIIAEIVKIVRFLCLV